jgi:hypothetical protein
MTTWKKDGEWLICNDCESLDENSNKRKWKCRTTNPEKFNLCDIEKDVKS